MNAQAAAALPTPPTPASVLSKAVVRAAEQMELSKTQLAQVIGVSPPTVTRIWQGSYRLEPESKPGELALLFVRLFRALDALAGPSSAAWLRGGNAAFGGRAPIELITHAQGLVHVVDYLDAHAGRG